MLGVRHMVCAEDAGAGVALERQKICRERVGLQVQRDLDVIPTHSSLPLRGRENAAQFATNCTRSYATISLATPP